MPQPKPELATPNVTTTPATILVVDDTPINLQIMVRTLSDSGHRILAARNGKSAIDIAERTHPDLILLDVMMPEMDGFEVCRVLKANPVLQDIVVIFLSALGEVEDKVAGLKLGAVDYITKPIQAEEVLARVSNHLTVQRLQRELRASRDELDQELASAALMQRLLLPQSLPVVGKLRFAAHYQTSRHAGGDYYDILPLSDACCGVLVADVSGHGAPSAIVMAMIRALVHSRPNLFDQPAAMLEYINQHFSYLWGTGVLATIFYAVWDASKMRLSTVCAGHPPPILLREGRVTDLQMNPCVPLLMMDLPSIPTTDFDLQPGDRVLLYTDGIIERHNPSGEMYEIERLKAALFDSRLSEDDQLIAEIVRAVDRFGGSEEPHDDQTLLLMSVDRATQ